MMDKGRIVLELAPDEVCTRQSEGDFCRLPDGSILFAYSRFTQSGDDDAPSDIMGRLSRDEGDTWTEPVTLISAARHGVKNVMSLTLMNMANGDIGMFYLIKQSPLENRVMLARSKDGLTFGEAVECQNTARKGLYILNNQRAERLNCGRIILPVALHYASMGKQGRLFNGYGECYCLCSDDDGYTWREMPGQIHASFTRSHSGLQEPGIVEMRNGALWMYARTDMMYQYECFSNDGGESWTLPQPSRFTSPQSPMKIARSPYNGVLYSIWNPIPNYNGREYTHYNGGRTPLVIARSDNDGRTWSEPYVLEDNPDCGYCYPAMFFLPDGRALVAYCAGDIPDGGCLNRTRVRKIEL